MRISRITARFSADVHHDLSYGRFMFDDLPHDDALYAALLARDPSFEGRAYVAVSSTGIFCRLTCPARKPKRENCSFHKTIAACIEEGYRPCKRCHPLEPAAKGDPAIQHLVQLLEQDTTRRWQEADIVKLGYDPSTIRRSFKRQFGMTFLEMARLSRLRDGFNALAEGNKVIDAQQDAGFSSASAFRAAFAKWLGMPPSSFQQEALLRADMINSPLGAMIAVSDKSHLHLLEFTCRKALPTELKKLWKATKGQIGFGRLAPTDQVERELEDYYAGHRPRFEVPMALHGSPFTRTVWEALQDIPAGQTRTYSQLARELGRPDATRAVARANGANQIAILIPCHRVLGADGALTGYGGGLWRKQKLIEIEQAYQNGL